MIKKSNSQKPKKWKYPKTRDIAKKKDLREIIKKAPVEKKKKRLKDVMDEINGDTGLTMKEEIFCRCYATTRESFGNGVQSYIEAYKPDMTKHGWYGVARTMAYNLLTKVDIMKRINSLLSNEGWNHGHIDKQILFVASQFGDLKAKVAAAREYNRVTKRVDDAPKIPVSFEIVINAPALPPEHKQNGTNNQSSDSAGQSTN